MRSRFADLLEAAVRDPALLIWLDAPSNHSEHPNENLARELMELFTLGIGHYSETDVKQAARALTGWTSRTKQFVEDPAAHDDGEKMILGRPGKWSGSDLVKMLLENPATSLRLAWRICDTFLGEEAVSANDVAALAAGLRQRDLDIAWGVETVLRSEAFFAEANLGRRVLSPVEYVVGAVRALELDDPPPSTVALAAEIALHGPGSLLSGRTSAAGPAAAAGSSPGRWSAAPTSRRRSWPHEYLGETNRFRRKTWLRVTAGRLTATARYGFSRKLLLGTHATTGQRVPQWHEHPQHCLRHHKLNRFDVIRLLLPEEAHMISRRDLLRRFHAGVARSGGSRLHRTDRARFRAGS